MSISVLNSDAGLSGTTIVNAESAQTVTGLKTFDRDPSAPFAVSSGSAVVTNLDADKLDGEEGSAYHAAANLTGTVATARLGSGSATSGTYLRGDQTWAAVPAALSASYVDAYNNAAQTVTTGNTTQLTLNTEVADVTGLFASNRFTVPTGGDGVWMVNAFASMTNVGSNDPSMTLHLRKNGSTVRQFLVEDHGSTTPAHAAALTFIGPLVATDYFELFGQAANGDTSFGSSTAAAATRLQAIRLF